MEFVVRYFLEALQISLMGRPPAKFTADFSNKRSAIVVPIGQSLRQSIHILSL
jgi:hypothetical protein